MKKIVYSLFLLIHASTLSSEESTNRTEYYITNKYKAGEFLIYDCEQEFYACVNSEANQQCVSRRQSAISNRAKKYPCAPLKKLDDKKNCILSNYKAVESGKLKRFCFPQNERLN